MRLDGAPVPEAPGEVRACLAVRDEALRLPSCLDHHRRLGVDRFLIVDNGSIDGTLDYLAAQPDVCLFHTTESFSAARAGLAWTNAMRDAFCEGHWTLSIDADELFIFPGYERVGLRALCDHLDGAGAELLLALLLDLYGPGGLDEATHVPGADLIETCPFFDPGPYSYLRVGSFPHVQFTGGVRDRIFDFRRYQPRPPVISKAPLARWRRGMAYTMSTHAVTPGRVYPALAVLLHFKFLSDFRERVRLAIERGQHYGGSQEYRAYQDVLRQAGDLRLANEQSVRFEGSAQLLRLRLMQTDVAYDAFLAGQTAAE
ncbi:glycosyltransferase family 2 protein [uncultured Phenylobacterium sp.]|uniref:glycosyltransferase family 2 protein n=1 Tax=uncultured Phenylobacterium sp. TaxID=349273 RepID=UPI0025D795B5|nr:glycosyltransferase family 2 protein [uncultured Phenylobacterium sp.]